MVFVSLARVGAGCFLLVLEGLTSATPFLSILSSSWFIINSLMMGLLVASTLVSLKGSSIFGHFDVVVAGSLFVQPVTVNLLSVAAKGSTP